MKTLFIFFVLAIFLISCAPVSELVDTNLVCIHNTTDSEKPFSINTLNFSIDGYAWETYNIIRNAEWTIIYLGNTYNIIVDHDLTIELTNTGLTY